jgi:thiol:disulfide interchange protein
MVLTAVALPAMADDVKWTEGSYETILKKAKAESRHVLIDFYTTWCGQIHGGDDPRKIRL